MKIKKYIIMNGIFIILFTFMSTYVFASDDFYKNAMNWYNKGSVTTYADSSNVWAVLKQFKDMVNVIGTSVIVIVTMFLGIKYMFSSVEGKADVKESLINLLIACVFFFGWNSIVNLLFPGNNFVFISSSDTSYKSLVGRIFSTTTYIAQIAAIIAVIYVGVKYIFSGAGGKADLKSKSGQFIIGLILTFCTITFLTYISNVINEII